MKNLKDIISERLHITKQTCIQTYKYFPKTRDELRKILVKRLAEDKNADLNDIDVSKITDMGLDSYTGKGLFDKLDPHNIDISKWDVSNVTNMNYIFYSCYNFNSDLSNWDVSKVTTMRSTFYRCYKFNSDLSEWNVSKVEDMTDMFVECTSLKNKPSWYKE